MLRNTRTEKLPSATVGLRPGVTSRKWVTGAEPARPWLRWKGQSSLLISLKFEFLAADTRFVHEPSVGQGEHLDAVGVFRVARLARLYRDGAHLGAKRKFAGLEVGQSLGRLEENQFRVGLSSGLKLPPWCRISKTMPG